MIDLPTQKDFESPHHRRAVGSLIAALIIFGIAFAVYYFRTEPVPVPEVVQQVEQWSAKDAAQKQAALDSISVRVTETLSPAALKEKQRILDTINGR